MRTPLVRDVLLLDGSTLRLRTPAPDDLDEIEAFYDGLSEESPTCEIGEVTMSLDITPSDAVPELVIVTVVPDEVPGIAEQVVAGRLAICSP